MNINEKRYIFNSFSYNNNSYNNNPIEQATKAVYSQDKVEVQSAITMFLATKMAEAKDVVVITAGTLNGATPTAAYTIGGTTTAFDFSTAVGSVGIALPSYSAESTIWSIDANGIVKLEVGPLGTEVAY